LISTELKKFYLKRRNITAGIAISIMAFFILRKIAGGNAEDPWYINLLMFLYLLCYIAACWFYQSRQISWGSSSTCVSKIDRQNPTISRVRLARQPISPTMPPAAFAKHHFAIQYLNDCMSVTDQERTSKI
jgi:hypothetical protein